MPTGFRIEDFGEVFPRDLCRTIEDESAFAASS
jgi:hypothetical protein